MTALETIKDIQDHRQVAMAVLDIYLLSKEGSTRTSYKRFLGALFTWLEKQRDPSLNPSNLHSYRMHLENHRGLKVNSINTHIASIKDFCRYCAELELLPYNPAKYLRRAKHKDTGNISKARALSDSEVMAMIGMTSKSSPQAFSDRLVVLFIFNLGLRIHEAMKVRRCDIDLDAGTIHIIGKGSKLRVLGTNSVLKAELQEYFDLINPGEDDYIIINKQCKGDKAPHRMYGHRLINDLGTKAGIDMEGVTTHSGRVTAINFLLENDVNLRDVANFAGHSDINTTRMYDRKDAKKVIETCNIISFGKDK